MINSISNKNLKIIDDYFQEFILFTQQKKNNFDYIEKTGNKKIDLLFSKWNKQIKQSDESLKADMKIIGEAVLISDKVRQGIFECRIKSETQNPTISTLKKTINNMLNSLDEEISEIENTVTSYANDDYTPSIQISEDMKGDMLSLMNSINLLSEKLNISAKNDLEKGEVLKKNSHTMCKSMQHLLTTANSQATSLEETSASVEEIASTTRNNAESASKMASLGKDVEKSVKKSNELAKKTASSMDIISEEVAEIYEAVNIIDKIAFQTNILSLNAAVEAAKAGNVGRGFAIVAQEVRNLANRSAESAKEIKNLVEVANTKAKEGKQISNDMIEEYTKLHDLTSQTTVLIKDVSNSSKEQNIGIELINDSISMLDRVTQEFAREAQETEQTSISVENIAEEIADNAHTKKFIAKEDKYE